VWSDLSSNQKLYFDNSQSNLQSEREKNVVLIGIFAIIIGVFIVVQTCTIHQLYSVGAQVWKPPMTSRLPIKDQHEQLAFVFHCFRDEDEVPFNQANGPNSNALNKEEEDEEMNNRIEVQQVDETDAELSKKKEIKDKRMASRYGGMIGNFDYSESRNQQPSPYPED
jgi:hypothetical protein